MSFGTADTAIESPLLLSSSDDVDWSAVADVIVVGWGAAGACAALQAREQGAEVIVIDRFEGGGASALSGGVVYAGGGTRQQVEAGYQDTPQAMFDYLKREVHDVVRDDTLRRFCEQSKSQLEWLEGHGVGFDSTMPPTKTSYPPDGCYLYFSGNEEVPAYVGPVPPSPRGHRVVALGQSGATLYAALRASTLRHGVQAITQATVRRLVCDQASGHVLGVEVWRLDPTSSPGRAHARLNAKANRWRNWRAGAAERCRREAAEIERAHARPQLLRARRGVILATGGFVFNRSMIKQHAPKYARGWKNGHAGCDGSGIRLGQSAGAATDGMNTVSAWRFITPPSYWTRGIVVNREGQRFCSEDLYGAAIGHAMVEEQGGKAWLVLDAQLRRAAIKECLFGKLWAFQRLPALAMMVWGAKKGSSIAALAAAMGVQESVLARQIDHHNDAAQGGFADPMGKAPALCQPLNRAPFYALDISMGSPLLPLATITLGGLRVREDDGRVVHQQGHAIPGLYAAGRAAIGIASHRYVSGLSLADCVFSGRRAGAAAATHTQEDR